MGFLKPKRTRLLLLWSLVTLLSLSCAFAQETTGGIQGTVKDQSGAVISKATVEVTSPALMGAMKDTTDAAGAFRFAQLPPGEYTLTVNVQGFRTYKQTGIDLSAGRLPTIGITLQVGQMQETVVVSGEAPSVDVTESKVAVTVGFEELNSLPKGRSFQSMIPFAAGARQEPLQGGTTTRDNGFQINGASDSENVYLIDGVNTTNIQNGGVGKNFQMDFIQEVQIKSASFEAEYGGAMGGVVNAVPKRGSNQWHGEFKTYIRTNALNANDPCASGYTSSGYSAVCGLRLNPNLAGASGSTRTDGTPEYYVPQKDKRRILEPGFEVGGPILTDRLWLYASYIPSLDTIQRTTVFTGSNPGPRTLVSTNNTHNSYDRLDYRVFKSLRLSAGWNYAYSRSAGTLGAPESAFGQKNTGASSDPNTFRSDAGSTSPLSVFTYSGDWTPTGRLVVTGRFGYFFSNTENRGRPTGTRYSYQETVNSASKDLAGLTFPTSSFNTAGYANIPANLATIYDAYKRKSFNGDVSYYVSQLWGTHTFKFGYAWMNQTNAVNSNYNGGAVNLFWNDNYTPVTSNTACDQVMAQNKTQFGQSVCQGRYGYFVVGTGVVNTGSDTSTSQALYAQDTWTVGKGLTLNLGVRFDKELIPPYRPIFNPVDFGWASKVAPRIGGAYDLLHNGKVKLYASYGQFYDIMKLGLPRGSFGSDYWHNCIYALDDPDYTKITPTLNLGGGCPASGPAPGVTVGRFIENVDFRATKQDPRDPALDPNMKPMKQQQYVAGADWAINKYWSLESRYTRIRLNNTIEDMAITDNLGFYIGNPGTTFADLLHRPTVIPDANGNNYLNTTPFCAECPPVVPAIRRYDSVEFRLSKRPTGKWFGAITYTYSKLTGNYAGLTNTDPTDGGGGRHAPNNGRAFDIPTMTYTPSGKIDDGPLATDRPNTAKMFGYYRLRWWKGQETLIGVIQSLYQGTPLSTCLPVVGTSSACEWAEGRGNFVNFHRASNGDWVSDGVVQDARTPAYIQTDMSLQHEIMVSKGNENRKLVFEINAINLLNQHAPVGYNEIVTGISSNLISPTRPSRFSGDPQVDWNKVMRGFNYVSEINAEKLTLANRYGLPQVFQGARNLRLAIRFTF
jgi:outer membrane receptor protein involved in Fe transport